MAKEKESTEWHLHSGQYLGEISALCFLHLPSHFSSLPLLFAGSGSQILLYDLESGRMMKSFQIFEGIRVHGISSTFANSTELLSLSSTVELKLAVFGEKRVKLYNLCVETVNEESVSLISLSLLPRFSHWVLDVCFLKMSHGSSLREESRCVAIGCSDNSVHLWDVSESVMILKVQSPERCLLYSMRLWGDEFKALRIASGTIFNEIIVWKVVPQYGCPPLTSPAKENINLNSHGHLQNLQYEAIHISRLVGHEGSIFRIAWSSDGSKLVSVSDDRSARIWPIDAERKDSDNRREVVCTVLFGHNARIWDCCIYDSLIVTAGEDCTCRAWALDGKQLKMIKEHVGRGIWRCLYDPSSSLLITAGFDSAIKVHQLHTSLSGVVDELAEITKCSDRRYFTIRIPNSLEHVGLMDSKSEYVRCLHFTSESTLYVATNRGFLYQAKLSDTADTRDVSWTELVRVSEEVPIVCMDLLPQIPGRLSCGVEDWIAVGDGQGRMTIIRAISDDCAPKFSLSFNWLAGSERQLLGTFWCKPLEHGYIFTADPRGMLRLWRLHDHAPSPSQNQTKISDVSLVAEFISCFGMRIMCLDASLGQEMLVCGDLRGNVVLFPLSKDLLEGVSDASGLKISPLNYFRGAHGISTVTSVTIARLSSDQIEIRTTGGDGCICHIEYDRDQKVLEFVGMRQVKELSLIQSISSDRNYVHDFTNDNYATGFASADFIIWNLTTESKVVQVHCGGWRRPHSCYLGDLPELNNCFAYVKDEVIHIHRHWVPDDERKIFPLKSRLQFHGRELHSLCFVPEGSKLTANEKHGILSRSSWISTGCEDGTVRLTRYTPGIECWSSSNLLGEHVGGSAVRSICSVSKLHIFASNTTDMPDGKSESDTEEPYLLISAGAKRVLTSWIQKYRQLDQKETTLSNLQNSGRGNGNKPSSGTSSSISFQWLSTDMPTKYSTSHKKSDCTEKMVAETGSSTTSSANLGILHQEKGKMELKSCLVDNYEDDWRYLAVTAFLVKCSGSMFTVCFVVVACSDATLALRALILPYRLWFDVASLVPLSSPILALQHVVIPKCIPSKGKTQNGNIYIVISGATDGSIAFWDLTERVEAFIHRLSTLKPEKFIDLQKRPRTGRGSQGGRWWKSLSSNMTKRRPKSISVTAKAGERNTLNKQNKVSCESSAETNSFESSKSSFAQPFCSTTLMQEVITDDSSFQICEIQPIHVMDNVHQSGVNCLHVSVLNNCQSYGSRLVYNLISGGDDQALYSLIFEVAMLSASSNSEINTPEFVNSTTDSERMKSFILHSRNFDKKYRIRFLYCQTIASAHSSAVKGVWTDGIWVFSTGLDQRIRCWRIDEQSKIFEYAHVIISVPEPEALDARACDRNHYQIAVAGRGMQMIEFSAS